MVYGREELDMVKILAAEDAEGNIYSTTLWVWDKESVYYLLNGTNSEFKIVR